MPSFSRGLEKALHQAMNLARERAHEFATLDLLRAGLDEFDAVLLGDVVVVTLEAAAWDAGAICEVVEFVVRRVADQVAPFLAPPPPSGLVDQDRHGVHPATSPGTLTR